MKELYKVIHNGIEITVWFNEKTKLFRASSKAGSSHNPFDERLKNFCHGFEAPLQAELDVKSKIDEFLKITPRTYTELAQSITDSLTWTGYEDCHADEQIIEILVSNFIKTL